MFIAYRARHALIAAACLLGAAGAAATQDSAESFFKGHQISVIAVGSTSPRGA